MKNSEYVRIVQNIHEFGGMDMSKVVQYQMSIFGDYDNIRPEQDILIEFIRNQALQGFLPSAFNISTINPITGEVMQRPGLQMIQQASGWNITVVPDRIDVNYQLQPGRHIFSVIDDLTEQARAFLTATLEILSVGGKRLTINCRVEIEQSSYERSERFRSRITKFLDYYNDCKVPEWNISFAGNRLMQVAGKTEKVNEITNVMCIPLPEDKASISVMFDVNTIQHNMRERFDLHNMNEFFAYAKSKITQLQKVIVDEWERA